MLDSTIKTVAAMLGIVALEIYALSRGIDGVALGTVIAILAGVGEIGRAHV